MLTMDDLNMYNVRFRRYEGSIYIFNCSLWCSPDPIPIIGKMIAVESHLVGIWRTVVIKRKTSKVRSCTACKEVNIHCKSQKLKRRVASKLALLKKQGCSHLSVPSGRKVPDSTSEKNGSGVMPTSSMIGWSPTIFRTPILLHWNRSRFRTRWQTSRLLQQALCVQNLRDWNFVTWLWSHQTLTYCSLSHLHMTVPYLPQHYFQLSTNLLLLPTQNFHSFGDVKHDIQLIVVQKSIRTCIFQSW